jgi:hypothetical protein
MEKLALKGFSDQNMRHRNQKYQMLVLQSYVIFSNYYIEILKSIIHYRGET